VLPQLETAAQHMWHLTEPQAPRLAAAP
jgi:hypothetical protein